MKRTLIIAVALLLCFSAFADDSYRTYFPSLTEVQTCPVDKNIGQLVDSNATTTHQLLAEALSQPFSFEWCEKYIAANARKNLTTLYSSTLSELLPASSSLFSGLNKNADNTVSVTVKFPETDEILLFVVSNNSIIGINNLKK